MAFFIARNRFLVFVNDPKGIVTLQFVSDVLRDCVMGVTADAGQLTVRRGDGPAMHVSVTRDRSAKILASRLAGAPSEHGESFASIDAHTEVSFEDLDETLDEMNTLIDVQCALQDATGGVVYRAWNQTFSGPEESANR